MNESIETIKAACATGMFERVRLSTKSGDLVAVVLLPRYLPPADILQWGARSFRLMPGEQTPTGRMLDDSLDLPQPSLEYRECFAVYVVPIYGVTMNGYGN